MHFWEAYVEVKNYNIKLSIPFLDRHNHRLFDYVQGVLVFVLPLNVISIN